MAIEIKVPKINPKCRNFEIGVRNLRDITIWPLSLADELEFSEKIIGLVDNFDSVVNQPLSVIPPVDDDDVISVEEEDNIELRIATYILSAIKEHLIELLIYMTDEEVTLKDLDNEQFIELCELIFDMNFDGAAGKIKRLLNKVKNLFPQKTLSENLSSPPVTDMNISSDSVTETEE